MWMITTRGFYSAVQKRNDPPNMLTIRARAREDLENLSDLLPDIEIKDGGGTDYPYRTRVLVSDWARVCATLALEVDYSNFKDEVKKKQGKARADIYMRIWSALLSLTPRGVREAQWAAQDALWDSDRRHRPAGVKTAPKKKPAKKKAARRS